MSNKVILPYIESYAHLHSIINVVFDNLKCEKTKSSITVDFLNHGTLFFLTGDEHKTEFLCLLFDQIITVNLNTCTYVTRDMF